MKSFFLIILFLFYFPSLQAHPLELLTHQLPKHTECLNYICYGKIYKKPKSFYIELLNELKEKLKYSSKVKKVPFKRGIHSVQEFDNIVFLGVQRTKQRENTVKWVGPITSFEKRDYFFEWEARPTFIRKIEDAKNLRVCVLRGSVDDELLSKIDFTEIYKNLCYAKCFQMLKLNRVDLVVTSLGRFQRNLVKANIPLSKVKQTPVEVISSNIYIAFSKNISDIEVAKWDKALFDIKKSGRLAELAMRYATP